MAEDSALITRRRRAFAAFRRDVATPHVPDAVLHAIHGQVVSRRRLGVRGEHRLLEDLCLSRDAALQLLRRVEDRLGRRGRYDRSTSPHVEDMRTVRDLVLVVDRALSAPPPLPGAPVAPLCRGLPVSSRAMASLVPPARPGLLGWFVGAPILVVLAVLSIPFAPLLLLWRWMTERRRASRRREPTPAESALCVFARSFNRQRTDPWVIRAVHERFQPLVGRPLRGDDRPCGDLGIDEVEVIDALDDAAERCGRQLPADCAWLPPLELATVQDFVRVVDGAPLVPLVAERRRQPARRGRLGTH